MSKPCILLLMVFLLLPTPSLAQNSRAASVAANKSWRPFWVRFNQAVKNNDRVALRRMISDDFDDNGGGGSADEYVVQILSKETKSEYQKSLVSGTKTFKFGEQSSRITRRNEHPQLIFEFGKDRRWRWVALMGD